MSPRSSNGKGSNSAQTGSRQGSQAPPRVPRLDETLETRSARELDEAYAFWSQGRDASSPPDASQVRAELLEWLQEPAWVDQRVAQLEVGQAGVVELLLGSPSHARSWNELVNARALSRMSAYELEACLSALQRQALVVECIGQGGGSYSERAFAVPHEIAEGLVKYRRARQSGVFHQLTLRGHLERLYADPERAKRSTPQRLREMYKMYSRESAAVARIERLPEGVRGLVEKAILEFGGILPRHLFERMDTELPHWNGRRWKILLENSLVGTVAEFDLSRYGIQHRDETLVVFNEVALAWLRRVAVPGDPDNPYEELSLGIDLISNLSRFLNYIAEHDVRFTVRGEIFKTTEKRILQHLIPNPGRELSREEVLAFLFQFARGRELIDSTGERTFAVTSAGRAWPQHKLADKLEALLDFATDEEGHGGEYFHQLRMRRILVRLLKRVEPGVWYDLMYLPFLARNTYLTTLADMEVDTYFADSSTPGARSTFEDPQRMAWNLVRWLRQRVYLLGLVDLGYDSSKRPVAIRLSHSGARLIGAVENAASNGQGVGSVIVTPDFEVVLFRTGDDAELIHDLDRFCVREKLGELIHFRISEQSVVRALKEGMYLERVLATLEQASRTPVPQNVIYSIRDWAQRAGVMSLGKDWIVVCEDRETLRRLQQDPGARTHVEKMLDERRVKLKERFTPRRMQALLRELDYLVEFNGRN